MNKFIFLGFLLFNQALVAGEHGNCVNDASSGACDINLRPCQELTSIENFVARTDKEGLSYVNDLVNFVAKVNLHFAKKIQNYMKDNEVCVVDWDLNKYYPRQDEKQRISLWVKSAASLNNHASDRIYIHQQEFFQKTITDNKDRTAAIFSKLFAPYTQDLQDPNRVSQILWETTAFSMQYLQDYQSGQQEEALKNLNHMLLRKGYYPTYQGKYAKENHQTMAELFMEGNFEDLRAYLLQAKKYLNARYIDVDAIIHSADPVLYHDLDAHLMQNLDQYTESLLALVEYGKEIELKMLVKPEQRYCATPFRLFALGHFEEAMEFLNTPFNEYFYHDRYVDVPPAAHPCFSHLSEEIDASKASKVLLWLRLKTPEQRTRLLQYFAENSESMTKYDIEHTIRLVKESTRGKEKREYLRMLEAIK